jgi:hypothetical protein
MSFVMHPPLHLRVIEHLRAKPMTSLQMSWALRREHGEVSTLLSKMAVYGAIERDKHNGRGWLYRVKQETVA